MVKWNAHDMPDQSGRVAIITGANSGLGYESSLALARKGATVVMGVRNLERGAAAEAEVKQAVPEADTVVMQLDLGSLQSVRSFVEDFRSRFDRLDLLLNNAGVMAPPRGETEDGFELQIGINHLGHFALTGLLLDMLAETGTADTPSRVVTVSSGAHRNGTLQFDDLHGEASYSRYGYYSQSKLANVLFALELQRRLVAAGLPIQSLAAHPGLANTELQTNTASYSGNKFERVLYALLMPVMSQSQAMGALPQLYAATAPAAQGGEFYGPAILTVRGNPTKETPSKAARDEASARRLWEISVAATGVDYGLLAGASASGN